jgi:hypothetical protein
MMPAASCASKGETSSDTQPSTPLVLVDGTEQVGGPGQILDRELEKQRLAGFPFSRQSPDGGVVEICLRDGSIKKSWGWTSIRSLKAR